MLKGLMRNRKDCIIESGYRFRSSHLRPSLRRNILPKRVKGNVCILCILNRFARELAHTHTVVHYLFLHLYYMYIHGTQIS